MATRKHFLSKWLKFNGTNEEFSLKQILDWEYYWKRLESCIQKVFIMFHKNSLISIISF